MVDSESLSIEAFRLNQNNHWELEEFKDDTESLPIPTLNISIYLHEIYQGTRF